MDALVDVSANFRSDRVISSDILYNLSDNTENVIWYNKGPCTLKLAPCPEFAEILKKYRGM